MNLKIGISFLLCQVGTAPLLLHISHLLLSVITALLTAYCNCWLSVGTICIGFFCFCFFFRLLIKDSLDALWFTEDFVLFFMLNLLLFCFSLVLVFVYFWIKFFFKEGLMERGTFMKTLSHPHHGARNEISNLSSNIQGVRNNI